MAASVVSTQSGGGGGPLSLMSCVRESSPQESITELETDRNGGTKKTFWKFTRWFKRRSNKVAEDIAPTAETLETHSKEGVRSRSTSELSDNEEPIRRKSGGGTMMHPGLSVSHDSIFHSPQSGSELELDAAQSSSSLYIHQPTQTELRLHSELSERLRLRRGRGDTSEDDEGLPRSPCNSPTATESLLDKVPIKEHATKSHSTCSDGSLLSMGSSDTEEDSFGLQPSRHSSKVSLHEKKMSEQDSDLDLSSASTPLNHDAAHHRVAVRPKRTHGAPRRRKMQQLSGTTLPTTPEVNEESSNIRSLTPESSREIIRELSTSMSMSKSRAQISEEIRLKCSSLPPGLARPEDMSKLSRSQSSAGSKSQNLIGALEEGDEKEEKNHSIFGRFFPRRSGKKKKATAVKQELTSNITSSSAEILSETTSNKASETNNTRTSVSLTSEMRSSHQSSESMFMQKPMPLPRTGPAARQRVQPIDIPPSPEVKHHNISRSPAAIPKASPEKAHGTSPLHAELENRFKNHLTGITTTDSKPPLPRGDSPQSPKPLRLPINGFESSSKSDWTESVQQRKVSNTRLFETKEESKIRHFETREESKVRYFETREETRHRAKIAGLSSLQQRVMHHNDDSDDVGYKSLTDLPSNEPLERKPVIKSHSFKTSKALSSSSKDGEDIKENLYRFVASVTNKETEENSVAIEKKKEVTEVFSNKSDDTKKEEFEKNDKESLEDDKMQTSDSNESLASLNSTKTSSTEFLDSLAPCNDVTVCGPSHTAVITVCSNSENDSLPSQMFTIKTEKEEGVKEKIETQKSTKEQFNECISNGDLLIKERNIQEQTIVKEQQVSVTKIQVKQVGQGANTKKNIPEFLNIQLNKVDPKPTKNVVLTANLHSPKASDEEGKSKNEFHFENSTKEPLSPKLDVKRRRFSRDEIEIFEKETSSPEETTKSSTTPSPPTTNRIYKKNTDNGFQYPQARKSSIVSPVQESKTKLTLKTKSSSLEIVDCIKKSPDEPENKSLQNSLDKLDTRSEISSRTSSTSSLQNNGTSDGVTYRRKSLGRQKKDDEPELMKVFARRSLKIKDEDQETLQKEIDKYNKEETPDVNLYKSRDSDKENQSDSPSERKKFSSKDKDVNNKPPEPEKIKEPLSESKVVLPIKEFSKAKETERIKEPLQDSKVVVESTEVVLRKPFNQKFSSGFPRSTSLNVPKSQEPINNEKLQKHSSFAEKTKTEKIETSGRNWSNLKRQELEVKEEVFENIVQSEIIHDISSKSDFVNEDFPTIPKNFIQRKAEWEKRAQQALKKSVP